MLFSQSGGGSRRRVTLALNRYLQPIRARYRRVSVVVARTTILEAYMPPAQNLRDVANTVRRRRVP